MSFINQPEVIRMARKTGIALKRSKAGRKGGKKSRRGRAKKK